MLKIDQGEKAVMERLSSVSRDDARERLDIGMPAEKMPQYKFNNRYIRMLRTLVGYAYGPYPEERMSEILRNKKAEAELIARRIGLNDQDVLVDLGCGAGWISAALAPLVKKVIAVDVNKLCLQEAQRELAEFPHASVVCTSYGDLAPLYSARPTKIMALGLFTQFNLFDLSIYLKEARKCMTETSTFYFNFCNSRQLDIRHTPKFLRHEELYLENRFNQHLATWYSHEDISRFARQLGFRVVGQSDPLAESPEGWVLLGLE